MKIQTLEIKGGEILTVEIPAGTPNSAFPDIAQALCAGENKPARVIPLRPGMTIAKLTDAKLAEVGLVRSAGLKELLAKLKHGDCWCPMGIGNPMVTSHPDYCVKAQALFDALP
ncbi:MAG: hypothetical protein HZC54_00675 [Verrucomicrobia bacterium]|nr:hypothetical protein [Verrucomicrobiota bacterium]